MNTQPRSANLKLAMHLQGKSISYSRVEHLSSKVHLVNQLTTDELFKIQITQYQLFISTNVT